LRQYEKSNRLMLFKEVIAVYSDDLLWNTQIHWGQNSGAYFNVKVGGVCSNHSDLQAVWIRPYLNIFSSGSVNL
jgi:hypothetical protein